MNGYYEQILKEIQSCIRDGQWEKALSMVKEELSMPYTDPVYEKAYRECLDVIQAHLREERTVSEPVLTRDQIAGYLTGTPEQKMAAIRYLGNQNLRRWKDVTEEYFCKPGADPFVRGLLISELKAQEIGESYRILYQGRIERFSPAGTELPDESDAVKKTAELFQQWYSSEEPSFAELCTEVLAEEAFRRLPHLWSLPESEGLARKIAAYVYRISGREEESLARFGEKETNPPFSGRLFVEKEQEQSIINKS